MSFLDKAKEFADKHDKQVDQILEKVGDEVDKRTGHKHSAKIALWQFTSSQKNLLTCR